MIYREIPDTTVTTCDRALMFLVPAICAGNKVRNTIAISECGVGMVPAPFLQKLSDCGYQDIHNCPLLGESPHRTALAIFLKILQKSGYHPARNCPSMGEGQTKGGCKHGEDSAPKLHLVQVLCRNRCRLRNAATLANQGQRGKRCSWCRFAQLSLLYIYIPLLSFCILFPIWNRKHLHQPHQNTWNAGKSRFCRS